MLDSQILINEKETVKGALKKLDKSAKKVLMVVNGKNKLLGTITDGDTRRYILSSKKLDGSIKKVYNRNPIYIKRADFSLKMARKLLIENKIGLLPIVDEKYRVVDFSTWDVAFSETKTAAPRRAKISLPVVIMAGGKGTRLEPFTAILPKPLIPIGDKPIIEIIIEEFRQWGVKEYYITLNHKGAMVEAYFNPLPKDYKITYISEDESLGTAGSLKRMEDKIGDIFIVSNCDVIVKANFGDVLRNHKDQKAWLTILSSIQHFKIPYGIINFKEKGKITSITEKPEYTFTINTGVYLVNKDALKFMPHNASFDMTDLTKVLIENGNKVVMYPVNESDYIDIGQWEEYKKSIEKLQQISQG